ncbi:oligomeric Golgi complex subunit 7 [Boletus reticuloceps]|uniref:Conserved oligomeric Golgi complex subunit 7 n=1 Tax=Boletus reticuloceps TaxID=495285 RepID=A0A8I2YLB3_9AGAM|nr:oligomeric Golgi complex subunit 7 [Boletus reticuloceps]
MASTATVTAASVVEQLDKSSDVLTWLNTVLNVPGDATSNDLPLVVHASTLDALQTATSIAAQSTSATLEHIIDDIARAAPRLAYDIHFTRDGALALRNVLAQSLPPLQSRSSGRTTTDAAESDATSKILERLQHLDTLRVRMEAARDVLREAESWSALETEVTTLLAEKAYARAACRLSASARLMPVSAARTATTPSTSSGGVHEPRRALLTSLANQLEAALSPDLVRAVTACDVESCKSFYAIFVDIEREGEFRNYYYGTRRSSIVEIWSKAAIEGESGSSDSSDRENPQSLSAFYPSFLSSFLTMLSGERTALPNIFPDPERTHAALIYTTLSVLTPSPAQRLAALFHNGSSTTALKDVVKLFQASEEFARGAERILEKLRASAPPLLTASSSSSPSEGKPSRRRSVRMSMSWRSMSNMGRLGGGGIGTTGTTGSGSDEGAEWDQCLFQPFLDFQVDFGSLERRLLDETLGSPLPGNIRNLDGDRAARAMRERAVDVFSAAEESIERSLVFTHGYGSVGLVRALDTFISTFVETWTNSISSLVGTDPRSMPGSGSKPTSAALEDEELADLDYTSQDWAHIQKALHLLAAGRAVKDRLGMFETRLMASLRQVSTAFRMAWGNGGSGVYTPGITKGQGLLLAQSSLNALELRALLTRVAPSTRPGPSLLPRAHTALIAFARANQRGLQRVLLSPLYAHLAIYPTLPLWIAARVQDAVPGMAGVIVPTFSLSPSDVAHRVGDGLLNLPRLFEVYAEDDALGFELESLAGPDGSDMVVTGSGSAMGSGEADERRQGQVPHSPEVVTAAWLASLGRATVAHLTRDVLPQIKTLSGAGAAQLSADLGYLETIVRALGVEMGDLERWKACVGMTDEEGRAMLASDEGNDRIGQLVARMRKWVV